MGRPSREDEQRIGLDELLEMDQDIDLQPGEGILPEEAFNNMTFRIDSNIFPTIERSRANVCLSQSQP